MSRISIFILFLSLMITLSTWNVTAAHIGDRIFPIFEIHDRDLGNFDFRDRTLSEWEIIIGTPSLSATDFYADPTVGEGAQYNPSDLDYRIWLGWNDSTNRLYVAMERMDNVYINTYSGGNMGDLWSYDSMEFMVDGDHSGGDYTGSADPNWTADEQTLNNNRTAQQYVAIADAPDGRHAGYTAQRHKCGFPLEENASFVPVSSIYCATLQMRLPP